MTGKNILELPSVDNMTTGDLMLVRKSDIGTDKKISYQDLVKSIGNPGVDGFTAIADGDNKIMVAAANGAIITKYYAGMKISFVSPLKSTGAVQVSLSGLPYKNLSAYKSTASVAIEQGDYIEAVFIGDAFYQVNNAQYVYTNDYNVVLIEPNIVAGYTDITLQSAYGAVKTSYYTGMTVNFLCTEDTKGLTRVKIDGLQVKDVLENSGDYLDLIYNPLYKGQIVRLIYDGQTFIKDRFSNNDPKMEPIVAPDPDNPEQPLVPAQNIVEFNVGTGQKFKNLNEAISTVKKEYGDEGKKTGNQVYIILNITSDLIATENHLYLTGNNAWITVKAASNRIIIKGEYVWPALWQVAENSQIFSIKKDTSLDFTQITLTGSSSNKKNIISATHTSLILEDIEIKVNQNIDNIIYTIESSISLTNCKLTGGADRSIYAHASNLTTTNTMVSGWNLNGIYFTVKTDSILTSSNVTKSGTESNNDIYLNGYGVIYQSSDTLAGSNIAKNTNLLGQARWVK